MYNLLTPGPTKVRQNVLLARAMEAPNADLDPDFYAFYHDTCAKYSAFLHTTNESFLLSGEGILGLEAAVASLTEPSDRVLVLDNGIYGKGFADFVTLYGGVPVLLTTDMRRAIEPETVRAFLAQDHDFKYATLVHCDTPSGMLNDIHALYPILKEYGLLTVVDSVSGMFGNPVDVDAAGIDILCGGSQKALSCPPGLTMVTVSPAAFAAMEARKTPIAGFYCNLLAYKDYWKNQWFPYTMPSSDINGLARALDNVIEDERIFERHARIAAAVRSAVTDAGLTLYGENGYSDTVTVINVPEGISDTAILDRMLKVHGILIAGCFDVLAHKVIRIGHMGEGCNETDMLAVLSALDETLRHLGHPMQCSLPEAFRAHLTAEY